ncbi:unnamed protein product [Zymoseptoria tritici ST99CH_3D1]|uniref:Aspergillopepsin-2 n=1 Tax=Zymoseptoria tritici (strain ST99CH_3D7) TaxID=1276538 RepID=A0A1X7RXG0_ZYMT9|nr:unnamed protein product [Zymoseptoria tritici ST99CH_3D7]SMR57342.1 unnamed protein product [Zymoseptoria tritici ST99CH_3D1]
MKLCVVTSGLLFACLAAAATPPNSGLRSSERRQAGRRSELRPRGSGVAPSPDDSGWAGAIHSGKDITEVSGTFIIPQLSRPPNADADTTYVGSAWLGIDGDENCPGAILETGIDFFASPDGSVEVDAWSQWTPGYQYSFQSLKNLEAGVELHFHVKTNGATGGTATIYVPSTDETWTQTYTDQPALCQTSAEWVVENLLTTDENGNRMIPPLIDFSDLTFTGAKYTHDGGVQSGAAGSRPQAINVGGVVRAAGQAVGEDSVVIKYHASN